MRPRSGGGGLCLTGGYSLTVGVGLSPGPLLLLPPVRRPNCQVIPACLKGPLFQGRKSKGVSPPAHSHSPHLLSRIHPARSVGLGWGMVVLALVH